MYTHIYIFVSFPLEKVVFKRNINLFFSQKKKEKKKEKKKDKLS